MPVLTAGVMAGNSREDVEDNMVAVIARRHAPRRGQNAEASPVRVVRFRRDQTMGMRARALWTKVRVVVILNELLRRVRRGERFEKLSARDMLMVKFVGVSGPDIRDEIRRVQQKFNAPKAKRALLEMTWKQRIYLLLTEPTSSKAAMAIQIWMFSLIFLSIISFIVGTMPEHAGKASLDVIEMVCQLIFTIEYVLKISTAPKTLKAIRDPLNLIDLASIVPWYAEIAVSGLRFGYEGQGGSSTSSARVLRIFRLFRVVKVFRLGSRARKIQVVLIAVQDSADMFIVLGFLLLLGLVVFSAMIYFAENNKQTPTNAWEAIDGNEFESIPSSFWWCMVTLMTVGYGDAVPVTFWGKMVASVTMLASVIITALPISVIGANFTQQWLQFKAKEHRKSLKQNMRGNSNSILAEMYAYSQVVTALCDHIGATENVIMDEVNALRRLLSTIVHMAKKKAPKTEIKSVCRTLDVRFEKLENLREELEDLVEIYDLVSNTEFSVTLHQLKAAGNKRLKLEETAAMLDIDVEKLVTSTATLRSQLHELRDTVENATKKSPSYMESMQTP